jgi:hypothetical protein
MGLRDRVTNKARQRLEAQVMDSERVMLSANLAASALVLTDRRLMIAPAVAGSEPDINVPLRAIQNVSWQKGMLGNPGTLQVHTSERAHSYKVRNNEGESAALSIRQAMAASG